MKVATEKALPQYSSIETLRGYLELTKPGITLLVLASMLIGFLLGSAGQIEFATLFHAALGTILIAAGTAAHNQYIERDLDKLMLRTSKRPLPLERIPAWRALAFSLTLLFSGLFYLILMVNPIAGIISAITALLYLGAYTPMKRMTFTNVWVGAIPGALPPVGGWAAASGTIAEPGMWVLFGIVFLWQVPHVVAIAWLCNDDYCRAGFKMLPKNDTSGFRTALTCLICLVLIIPISAALFTLELNSWIYLTGAILSGLYFLFYGIKFQLERNLDNARKLMFGSLVYLPVVWLFILIDRVVLFYIF